MDGRVRWQWSTPELCVSGVATIPGSKDALVLAERVSSLPRGARTLFRCRPDGTRSWTAEVLADYDGTYVEARIEGDEVMANTWDGRLVSIDIETGKIKNVEFVK